MREKINGGQEAEYNKKITKKIIKLKKTGGIFYIKLKYNNNYN